MKSTHYVRRENAKKKKIKVFSFSSAKFSCDNKVVLVLPEKEEVICVNILNIILFLLN